MRRCIVYERTRHHRRHSGSFNGIPARRQTLGIVLRRRNRSSEIDKLIHPSLHAFYSRKYVSTIISRRRSTPRLPLVRRSNPPARFWTDFVERTSDLRHRIGPTGNSPSLPARSYAESHQQPIPARNIRRQHSRRPHFCSHGDSTALTVGRSSDGNWCRGGSVAGSAGWILRFPLDGIHFRRRAAHAEAERFVSVLCRELGVGDGGIRRRPGKLAVERGALASNIDFCLVRIFAAIYQALHSHRSRVYLGGQTPPAREELRGFFVSFVREKPDLHSKFRSSVALSSSRFSHSLSATPLSPLRCLLPRPLDRSLVATD